MMPSKFFLREKSTVFPANRTAWKREITEPDFVSARRALHGGYTQKVLERRASVVMEVVVVCVCVGGGILSINHHRDKALQ